MSDASVTLFPAVPPAPPREAARTDPPRSRPRGPVLMGDLSASYGGRPLLLLHWDEPET